MRRRMFLAAATTIVLISLALPATPASAAFPGHNGRIVFSVHGHANIATMKPDGTGRTTLTSFSGATAEYPRYSSNGKQIVFDASDPIGQPTSSYDIYKMSSTGAHLRQLTSDTSSYDDWGATFSPSGAQIAFISDRSGGSNVWTMDADGTNPVQISTGGGAEYTSWSPNGNWILFGAFVSGALEIYRVHPNGTSQGALTALPFTGSGPDWSPDGSRITFYGSNTGGTAQIWVMNADGTHRHQLTTGSTGAFNPTWSPDGKWIAFDQAPPASKGVRRILKVRADGTGLTPISGPAANDSEPSWQPT